MKSNFSFLKKSASYVSDTLLCIGVTLSLIGCLDPIEFDWSNSGFLSSGSSNYTYNITDYDLDAFLQIDSAIDIENNSAVLVCQVHSSFRDSIIVFTETKIRFRRTDNATQSWSYRKFQTGPDTVNFKKISPFEFQLKLIAYRRGPAIYFSSQEIIQTGQSQTLQYAY